MGIDFIVDGFVGPCDRRQSIFSHIKQRIQPALSSGFKKRPTIIFIFFNVHLELKLQLELSMVFKVGLTLKDDLESMVKDLFLL